MRDTIVFKYVMLLLIAIVALGCMAVLSDNTNPTNVEWAGRFLVAFGPIGVGFLRS
jgi:hypothetical protein